MAVGRIFDQHCDLGSSAILWTNQLYRASPRHQREHTPAQVFTRASGVALGFRGQFGSNRFGQLVIGIGFKPSAHGEPLGCLVSMPNHFNDGTGWPMGGSIDSPGSDRLNYAIRMIEFCSRSRGDKDHAEAWKEMVEGEGFEPSKAEPSDLQSDPVDRLGIPPGLELQGWLAEWTGLEPATPGVTGRYSNQLNYHSRCWHRFQKNRKVMQCSQLLSRTGGGKRDRTADLLHAMQALSQLSYTPARKRCGL